MTLSFSSVKALLNPFDVTDAESTNITPSEFAVMTDLGDKLSNLSAPAQGAMLGAAVATPGGGALYKKKMFSGLALGTGLGVALTLVAHRLRRR